MSFFVPRFYDDVSSTDRSAAPQFLPTIAWLAVGACICLLLLLQSAAPVLAQDTPPQSSPPFDITQAPAPLSPPIADSGHAIYQENCAPCHGAQGNGDGATVPDLPAPPTKFSDPAAIWERSPAQLFHTAKFGRLEKLMPPWQNKLDDKQIWDTIAYAWSLHTTQLEVMAGADLYQSSCASCHGERGAGDGPQANGMQLDLGDLAYAMTRSQADWSVGWRAVHADVGAEWSSEDEQKVLEYIRTFSYVPPWQSPYRPGNGVILGQVVRQAESSEPLTATQVALEAFVDFQRVAVFTTTLDAAGQFQFQNLSVDAGVVYMASASSEGVSYSSPILSLSPATSTITATIPIYGKTDDPSGVQIERTHWILNSQPGGLVVIEIYEFSNRGERTFVGAKVEGIDPAVTLALSVPPGAQEISLENGQFGDRYRQQGNVIYDTMPVLPGEATRQIVLQYAIPYDGTELELRQEYSYPITTLNLLISDLPDLQAEIGELTSLRPQDIQGNSYQLWQGRDLQPGSISIKLSGLLAAGDIDPRAGSASGAAAADTSDVDSTALLPTWTSWLIALVFTGLLAGVFAWSWHKGLMHTATRVIDLKARRSALLQQIAQLDDLHALGQIDESKWQQTRSRLKVELLGTETRLTSDSR